MKAAVFYGPFDIRLQELDETAPPIDMVKVRVEYCGICGTDLIRYQYDSVHIGVIPGHEICGEVVEVGSQVENWRKGDWVVVNPLAGCGQCYWCQHSSLHLCSSLNVLGTAAHGGFAEHVLVPPRQLHRMPDGMSHQAAALVEPLAVALRAIKRGHVQVGESAAIVGDGVIGLFNLLALRMAGIGPVFFVGKHECRKELAKRLGANVVFDGRDKHLSDLITECTGGVGADVCFECAGSIEALNTCMVLTRKGGRVVTESNLQRHDHFRADSMCSLLRIKPAEISLVGSFAYADEFESSILALANQPSPAIEVISSIIHLDEIVTGGYERLLAHKDQEVKIIVKP